MKLIDREIQQLTAIAGASQPLPATFRIAPLALLDKVGEKSAKDIRPDRDDRWLTQALPTCPFHTQLRRRCFTTS